MLLEALVIAGAAWIIVFAMLGAWIAGRRDRALMEGVILGSLFGPLGCMIELLLPEDEPAPPRVRPSIPPPSIPSRPDEILAAGVLSSICTGPRPAATPIPRESLPDWLAGDAALSDREARRKIEQSRIDLPIRL